MTLAEKITAIEKEIADFDSKVLEIKSNYTEDGYSAIEGQAEGIKAKREELVKLRGLFATETAPVEKNTVELGNPAGLEVKSASGGSIGSSTKIFPYAKKNSIFSSPQVAHDFATYLQAIAKNKIDVIENISNQYSLDTKSAFVSYDDARGGFLVPDMMLADIMVERDSVGILRRYAQRVTTSSQNIQWRERYGTIHTPQFVPEMPSGNLPNGTMNYSKKGISLSKATMQYAWSEDLDADIVENFASMFAQEIIYHFGAFEDRLGFYGTGSDEDGNIIGLNNAILAIDSDPANIKAIVDGGSSWDSIDIAKLDAMKLALPVRYRPSARYYCHPNFFETVILPIIRDNGGVTGIERVNGWEYRFEGVGFEFIESFPDNFENGSMPLFYGDLSQCLVLFERQGLTFKQETDFDTDSVKLRATQRFFIHPQNLGDTAKAGAIVALYHD